MDFTTRHGHVEGGDALVAVDGLHAGGFTNHDYRGGRQLAANDLDHLRRAKTADFLVIGECQMHGPRQVCRGKLRGGRQRQGQEALHVAGPAPEQPLALLRERKGVRTPGLAVHRHHVGVAR